MSLEQIDVKKGGAQKAVQKQLHYNNNFQIKDLRG